MRNPLQVATELETFKKAHNGGAIIDEAVKTIRDQHNEIVGLTDAKMRCRDLLRFAKRVLGKRLERIAIRKIKKVKGVEQVIYILPTVTDRQVFDMIVNDCEGVIPDSGVYGKV